MAKKASATTKKPASKTRGGKTTNGAKAQKGEDGTGLLLEGEPIGYRGELLQLASLSAAFEPLPAAASAAFLAQHPADACRKNAESTKASDIFRAAMSWARILAEKSGSPGLHPARVRWFFDCTTALGSALAGETTLPNPSDEATYADVVARTSKLLTRTTRKLGEAAGSRAPYKEALRAARASQGHDKHALVFRSLAALTKKWLDDRTLNLAPNDITPSTVKSLNDAAKELEATIANRRAARQAQHDSPAVNELEGRLLFAMRPLWHDLREAREDGTTNLVLTVSPSLLRGLGIRRTKEKPDAPEA